MKTENSPIQANFDRLSIPTRLLTAGTAACFADFATFPLDTAKVRLQIQGEVRVPVPIAAATASSIKAAAAPNVALQRMFHGNATTTAALHYRGLLGTIATISREEGFRSLYNGLNAGLQRQMCFASIRLGLYEPTKVHYQKLMNVTESGFMDVSARVMAGLSVGAVAVLVAQPTDVVKLRFQAQQKSSSSSHNYKSTWNAYTQIFKKEGVFGLWKGTLPNAGRNAIVNVSEIVCYDLVKEAILKRNLMSDNIPCHFVSAVVAGFCATVCASPVDVVKTRYINSKNGTYSGAMDCAVKTFLREGAPAFYKGFWVSFSRLVSWNIVMWISYEQLKAIVVESKRSKIEGI